MVLIIYLGWIGPQFIYESWRLLLYANLLTFDIVLLLSYNGLSDGDIYCIFVKGFPFYVSCGYALVNDIISCSSDRVLQTPLQGWIMAIVSCQNHFTLLVQQKRKVKFIYCFQVKICYHQNLYLLCRWWPFWVDLQECTLR